MILSGIIAASGKRAGPPSPDPPPAPVYQIVGEPNADGTAGGTHNFQASNILAQRYTAGVAGRVVALLAYFHGTGTPSFRMSLYADSGDLPAALLAAVEGQAPGVQGWHELALDPAHHLNVSDTTVLWIGAQTSANIDSRAPSGGAANSGRRLRSFTFGNGAPDPFGTSSTYNNTRGLRMKIWTNP
jgi:hypothetical protein